jgi:hypothetical protein
LSPPRRIDVCARRNLRSGARAFQKREELISAEIEDAFTEAGYDHDVENDAEKPPPSWRTEARILRLDF